MAYGLSCSAACGILPAQGSNSRLLHWQADSLPLSPQGSAPWLVFYFALDFFFFFFEVRNTVMSKTDGHSGDYMVARKTNHTQLSKNYKQWKVDRKEKR